MTRSVRLDDSWVSADAQAWSSDAWQDTVASVWDGSAWVDDDPGDESPPSYVEAVLADVPTGYWPLDETSGTTIVDASGNGNDGEISGSYTLAQAGPVDETAISFDDGRIEVPFDAAFNTVAGEWSAEVWFSNPGVGGQQILMGRENGTGTESWSSTLHTPGRADVYYRGTAGYQILDGPDDVWDVDEWHHYVAVRKAKGLTVWIDGEIVGLLVTNGSLESETSIPLTIGGQSDGSSNHFVGSLAHAAFYPVALSRAQIEAHREALIPGSTSVEVDHGAFGVAVLGDSPVAFWPLDDVPGTTVTDVSGNGHHGVCRGSLVPGGATLLGLTVPTFDGSGYIDLPAIDIGTGPYSLEGVAMRVSGGEQAFILGEIYNGNTVSASIGNYIGFEAPGITAGGYFGGGHWVVLADGPWTSGEPHHVVYTYDGTTGVLYVDGDLIASGAMGAVASNDGWVIGTNHGRNAHWTGTIGGVALYDTVLTDVQVAAHYEALVPTVSFADEVLADTPLGFWLLDETTGTVAADSSGNGLDGTYVGSPALAGSTLHSLTVPTFDGVDDYVTLPDPGLTDANHFTVEIVASRTGPSDSTFMLSRATGSSGLWLGYISTTGEFGATGFVDPNYSKGPMSADTPLHLVFAYQGGGEGIQLFINGSEYSARDTGPPTLASLGWLIGAYADPTAFATWAGALGGAALYDYTLSPARIAAHYAALTA